MTRLLPWVMALALALPFAVHKGDGPLAGNDRPMATGQARALSAGGNAYNCMQGLYADAGYADVPYLPTLDTRGRHDPCEEG